QEFLVFLKDIIIEISRFDPTIAPVEPQHCLFRLNRDVRFSNDKSPYKTHIGAFISKTGRQGNSPGYYIHIEPSNTFLAGGLYMPPPDLLKEVRNEIYYNHNEFRAILSHPDFIRLFGQLDESDKLSRPPKGVDASWPYVDLLKYKSYTATHMLNTEEVKTDHLRSVMVYVFGAMYPFIAFLYQAKGNQ
ncbi:MAG TPA: DUF2461 domain-containing protein, partial [Bacteroidales bacterium]|nr:DUF2461 domain-containing protein [Bacteroidales bacterium]